jgi:adenylate kinase family enzyme
MLCYNDIAIIIGLANSGKTTYAKYLASTLDKNFIYIDYVHTSYIELDKLYNKLYNENMKKVIVFDNYVDMIHNARRMDLFIKNNKFTLIFVLNYISHRLISKADTIYFGKNDNTNIINSYFESIQKYYNNKNKFVLSINKLINYGFLCLDKDNMYKNEEEFIYINI